MAIYLKSNYVPETLSFSKIYSERSFSSCKFFLTDVPANLLIEAPFPELKNLHQITQTLEKKGLGKLDIRGI